MTAFKHLLKLLAGILGFITIWAICLALSPVFITVIGAKYAQEFIFSNAERLLKKEEKILAIDKKVWHIPATKDNNIHSAN